MNWQNKISAVIIGAAIFIASSHAAEPTDNHLTAPVSTKPSAAIEAPTPVALPPARDGAVSTWANEIIVQIYTYNAATADTNLKNVAKYFTENGLPVFLNAINASKIIETVKKNQYSVSAVALDPPQITAKGVINGQFSWQVMMPTMVSYHNKTSQYKQYLDISLNIVFTGGNGGVRGLALTQFIAKQRDKPKNCQCD